MEGVHSRVRYLERKRKPEKCQESDRGV